MTGVPEVLASEPDEVGELVVAQHRARVGRRVPGRQHLVEGVALLERYVVIPGLRPVAAEVNEADIARRELLGPTHELEA